MPDLWMNVDAALSEVPVNLLPLLDDSDFKSRETGIAYNESGMDLVWNFVTTAGAFTQTAVTPTTGGDYDWTHQGDGMYTIEIPASGGASINNDTEGFGWFTGLCDGVLPWRGPTIGFRAAAVNDGLIDGGDYLQVDTIQIEGTAASSALASKEDIADQIWDEQKSGHVTAGTFGEEVQDHALSSEISALNDITAQNVVDELMAEVLESTKTYKQALLDIWAQIDGNSEADDANNPSVITYDSPDDTVQITHTFTSKTRTVS